MPVKGSDNPVPCNKLVLLRVLVRMSSAHAARETSLRGPFMVSRWRSTFWMASGEPNTLSTPRARSSFTVALLAST